MLKAAEEVIAGYCIVHDISEREFQLHRGGQWVKGKSCPGFSPAGHSLLPGMSSIGCIEPGDDIKGQRGEQGNREIPATWFLIPPILFGILSQFMKLEAGDLISTGTPPGVGLGMIPPHYLVDGDVVELEIESLGNQKQIFRKYDNIHDQSER
jgi:2,4-didehydro-3-deoxy-L-rhamnonate hydrolase